MLVGEEVHFETLGDLEGSLFLGRGHDLLRGDGRTGLRRRDKGLLPPGQGLDVPIPGSDQGLIGFEVLLQRRHRTKAFAVVLGNAVAIHERPIGRAPAIRPKAVLLDDRHTQFGREMKRLREAERNRDRSADLGQSGRREMHAIDGSFAARRLGQVDIRQAALLGDFSHGRGVSTQVLSTLGSGEVRGTTGRHETSG